LIAQEAEVETVLLCQSFVALPEPVLLAAVDLQAALEACLLGDAAERPLRQDQSSLRLGLEELVRQGHLDPRPDLQEALPLKIGHWVWVAVRLNQSATGDEGRTAVHMQQCKYTQRLTCAAWNHACK